MSTFNLSELLQTAGERMSQDLRQRLVGHPGEEGRGREEIVRQFLRAYLPKRFEVSTGFGFDSTGRRSKQVDIIIADSLVCPRFETPGGVRFYPCEGIVAVGQIRSSITSRKHFHDALANLASAKDLDRSANGRAVDQRYRETLNSKTNYLDQIFTFLLVTGNCLSAGTARDEFLSHLETQDCHQWPNVVLSLDNYLITHHCEDGVCPNPMHSRGVALQEGNSPNLLMRFFILLGRAIEVTRVSGFPHWEYLENACQWDAEVVHASGQPGSLLPPLLRKALF